MYANLRLCPNLYYDVQAYIVYVIDGEILNGASAGDIVH